RIGDGDDGDELAQWQRFRRYGLGARSAYRAGNAHACNGTNNPVLGSVASAVELHLASDSRAPKHTGESRVSPQLLQLICFWFFAVIAVAGALMVISLRNT